jgi:hypothetical protein
VLELPGLSQSAVVLGDRLVWAHTRGAHAISLVDGSRLWDGSSELIPALDAGTTGSGDIAVGLRGSGNPMQVRASVYDARDGALLREEDIDARACVLAATAFGSGCVPRATDFGESMSRFFCVGRESTVAVEIDGGGFGNVVPLWLGTPDRIVAGGMRFDVASETMEEGTRAYDRSGALSWASPLRLVSVRGAEHGVVAWKDGHGVVMLDPSTGAERWTSTVTGPHASVSAHVTADRVALVIGRQGANAEGVVPPGKQALAVLDAKTGATLWEVEVKGKELSPRRPLMVRDRLLFIDGAGALAACDLATGELVATAGERHGLEIFGASEHPFVAVLVRRPKEYCLRVYRAPTEP